MTKTEIESEAAFADEIYKDRAAVNREAQTVLSGLRRAASLARKSFGAGSGRPQVGQRCACGAMSQTRAKTRGHRCPA